MHNVLIVVMERCIATIGTAILYYAVETTKRTLHMMPVDDSCSCPEYVMDHSIHHIYKKYHYRNIQLESTLYCLLFRYRLYLSGNVAATCGVAMTTF